MGARRARLRTAASSARHERHTTGTRAGDGVTPPLPRSSLTLAEPSGVRTPRGDPGLLDSCPACVRATAEVLVNLRRGSGQRARTVARRCSAYTEETSVECRRPPPHRRREGPRREGSRPQWQRCSRSSPGRRRSPPWSNGRAGLAVAERRTCPRRRSGARPR